MKFFENALEIDTSSIMSFITSIAVLILVGPFRLMQEISKKIIYLEKKEIEKFLTMSAIVAMVFAVIGIILKIRTGHFSLSTGTMPIVLRLIGLAVLIGINVAFSVSNVFSYKSSGINTLHTIVGTTAQNAEESEVTQDFDEAAFDALLEDDTNEETNNRGGNATEEILTFEDITALSELDSYAAPVSSDINKEQIKKCLRKVPESFEQACTLFSEEEIAAMSEKLNNLKPENLIFSNIREDIIVDWLEEDEFITLSNTIEEIQDDFALIN